MRKNLSENIQTMPLMMFPKVDLSKDLLLKKDFITNSWFVCGHFESDGHILNFFYDVLIGGVPNQKSMIMESMSVTDQTTKETIDFSKAYPAEICTVSDDCLNIITPTASLSGTLDQFNLKASVKNIDINVTLIPKGYPIYNAGDGNFNIAHLASYEYSLPQIETTGTMAIKGKSYTIDGISWFDRQWGGDSKAPTAAIPIVPKWAWMDLNLDNGDFLSLWALPINKEREIGWVTVLHPDGTQSIFNIEPLLPKVTEYYHSDITGIDYPVHWHISIPDADAQLEVISDPVNQEAYSAEVKSLTHFEGASFIKGTYGGNPVSGYCYVELMNWDSNFKENI